MTDVAGRHGRPDSPAGLARDRIRIAPSGYQSVVRAVRSALAERGGTRIGVTIADDDGFVTVFVATSFEVGAAGRELVRAAVRDELTGGTRYPGSITVIFIPRSQV